MQRFSLYSDASFMIGDEEGDFVYYEDAIAEVERLKQENEDLVTANTVLEAMKDIESQQVNILEKQNEQLREALKKCSPWLMTTEQCLICGGKFNHKDDCEYTRLTGGNGNV